MEGPWGQRWWICEKVGMRRERRRRRQEDQLLVLEELEERPLTNTARRRWWGWGVLARERWVERMGARCGSGLGRLYRGEVRMPAAGSSEVGGGRQRRDGVGIRAGAVCAKAQCQETREPS